MRYRTRLDHSDNSHAHSSSEPCCDDHAAAARYSTGVVVDEWVVTIANEKSEVMNAISRITNAPVSSSANA